MKGQKLRVCFTFSINSNINLAPVIDMKIGRTAVEYYVSVAIFMIFQY